MAKKRAEETNLKMLNDYVGDATRLQIAAKSEISIPQRRRAAQTLRLQTEAEIKRVTEDRERARRRHDAEVVQSQALAGALERRKAAQDARSGRSGASAASP